MTQKRGMKMNALTAFSHREQQLLAALEQAKDMDEAAAACSMALEQAACELAQDEQDDMARQRQQAVMACARRAPQMLRAACARGEMVLSGEAAGKAKGAQKYAALAGAFLLAALAVYELIEGRMAFALLQLAGACLLLAGMKRQPDAMRMQARGVACVDAQAAVRLLRELCQAADVCVGDLAMLERENGMARLSGTADEAMIELLSSLLEAKASGRGELALRSLAQAEQYLHMLGMETLAYSTEHAALFDILPTMGETRTIRPALVRDGQVIRRGAAACRQEGGVSA